MRSFALLGAGVLALAVTACGTTVPLTTTEAQASLGGGSTGGSDSTGGTTGLGTAAGSATGGLGTSATGQGGRGDGSAGAGSTSTTGLATSGTEAAGGPVGYPPGVSATTITIGLDYAVNASAAAAAMGAGGVNTGDPLAEQKAIMADINKHGGVLGRQLRYVAHPVDSTSTQSYDQQAQEECADFTQDHHVFAVLTDFVGDTLRNCLDKAGSVQVAVSAQSFTDASTYQRYPYFIQPATLSHERMALVWPSELAGNGYFGKWNTTTGQPGTAPVKLGILTLDNPAMKRTVQQVLIPALKARGYSDVRAVYAKDPQGTSDSGATVSQVQAAVLRFRQDGVTHFLPLDSGAGLSLYFGKNASSQRYYPRYGLNSGAGVQVLLDAGLFPKDQLNGAVGMGWEPLLDIAGADNPDNGPYSNAARRHCVQIMKSAGIDISGSAATRGAVEFCDMFSFLKAAIEAGGAPVARSSFLAGVNSLRNRFQSGLTFATFLDASHHDGVSQARPFAYQSACGCLRYAGAPHRLP